MCKRQEAILPARLLPGSAAGDESRGFRAADDGRHATSPGRRPAFPAGPGRPGRAPESARSPPVPGETAAAGVRTRDARHAAICSLFRDAAASPRARRDDGPAAGLSPRRPGQALVSSPGLACPGTSRHAWAGAAGRRSGRSASPRRGGRPGSGGGAVADVIGGPAAAARRPGLSGVGEGGGDLHGGAGAGRAVQRDAAPAASMRSLSPISAGAGAKAAPPRPSSRTLTCRTPSGAVTSTSAAGGVRVLDGVGQRLGDGA